MRQAPPLQTKVQQLFSNSTLAFVSTVDPTSVLVSSRPSDVADTRPTGPISRKGGGPFQISLVRSTQGRFLSGAICPTRRHYFPFCPCAILVVFYNRLIITDLGSLQIGLLPVDPLSRCLGSEQFKALVLVRSDTELLGPVPYFLDFMHIDPAAIRAASLGLVNPPTFLLQHRRKPAVPGFIRHVASKPGAPRAK